MSQADSAHSTSTARMIGRGASSRLALPSCRFCRDRAPASVRQKGAFVRLGPRQYAHAYCYLAAGRSAADLPAQERRAFTPRIVRAWLRHVLARQGLEYPL